MSGTRDRELATWQTFGAPQGFATYLYYWCPNMMPRYFPMRTPLYVENAAKRLMDYGYHAPTMSWPVAGTLRIEPTESETQAELDRFCDAMIGIHGEMQAVANGEADKQDNPLKHAPHTVHVLCADDWTRAYGREQACFPAPWTRASKFWPAVGRVDNVYGDRNLVCSCVGMEAYAEVK